MRCYRKHQGEEIKHNFERQYLSLFCVVEVTLRRLHRIELYLPMDFQSPRWYVKLWFYRNTNSFLLIVRSTLCKTWVVSKLFETPRSSISGLVFSILLDPPLNKIKYYRKSSQKSMVFSTIFFVEKIRWKNAIENLKKTSIIYRFFVDLKFWKNAAKNSLKNKRKIQRKNRLENLMKK